MAVPTVLRLMRNGVENPRRFGVELRSLTAGGETLGSEIAEWSRDVLGVELNEQYGQTECDLVVGFCSEIMPVVAGAIGKAVPGHQVEIIDDEGQVKTEGEIGEIAVRSPDPVMFLEYWKDPEATASKYLKGWLRTGDYGSKDEDGLFRFQGRRDEIIESGGYRIGPGEIEDCLMKHEAVELAGVIGVPHATRGQIVKAFIKLRSCHTADRNLEESLRRYVKERLEAHAYPRAIAFVDEMPLTKTGKILKTKLRRLHEEELLRDIELG